MAADRRKPAAVVALVTAAALAATALAGCGSNSHAPAAPVRPAAALRPIGAGLRGPAGLKASVYATGLPTVATMTFDARGRLWAAAAGLATHTYDGGYVIPRPGGRPRRG